MPRRSTKSGGNSEKKENKKEPADTAKSKKGAVKPADGAKEKNPSARNASRSAKDKDKEKPTRTAWDENSLLFQILPYILGFLGVMFAFFMGFPEKTGIFGSLAMVLRGLLSYAAWAIPLFLIIGAFRLQDDMRKDRVGQKLAFGGVCILFLAIFTALFYIAEFPSVRWSDLFYENAYQDAQQFKNGGIIGNFLGFLLYKATGSAAVFIAAFCALLFGLFEFGCTPADILAYTRDKIREKYHDLRHKPHDRKYTPKSTDADVESKANRTKASNPQTARPHTAYRCNRDMAYHLTKKNIDVDISDREPKRHSIFDSIGEKEQNEAEKQRIASENRETAQRDVEALSRGLSDKTVTDSQSKTLFPEESAAKTDAERDTPPFDLDDSGENAVFKPDPSAFDTVQSSGRVQSMVDPAAVSELANGEQLNDIFADGAVIEAGGMAMNPSVLSEGDVIDPAKGSPVDSELSDKEQGFEVESGKLTVSARPTLEELYSYPPVDLLKEDPNPATFTVTDELKATAVKLVDTLSNFGVRTKITNISCGPTVTRYELQPEVGVRVKSIQNLSDDIALHLAANGVRIEAPIPGKDAVGIEIPNKTVSTVYIRDLIEDPKFRALKSRISVCLGMDVAGSPVYMDIAKMPHLLIAGATGMGKSVCINSFIISILYKARPDEVKFILIDPKKG